MNRHQASTSQLQYYFKFKKNINFYIKYYNYNIIIIKVCHTALYRQYVSV